MAQSDSSEKNSSDVSGSDTHSSDTNPKGRKKARDHDTDDFRYSEEERDEDEDGQDEREGQEEGQGQGQGHGEGEGVGEGEGEDYERKMFIDGVARTPAKSVAHSGTDFRDRLFQADAHGVVEDLRGYCQMTGVRNGVEGCHILQRKLPDDLVRCQLTLTFWVLIYAIFSKQHLSMRLGCRLANSDLTTEDAASTAFYVSRPNRQLESC
jgi:hypothetical protein